MRRWLIGGAAIYLLASIVSARPGVVVTRDGGRYEGEISEKTDDVIVNTRGIQTVIPRTSINSISYAEGFDKQFADRLAKLGPTDVDGRLELARWAFDQKQYAKSREALDLVLQIDPNNRPAVDLQNTISSQMRLEQSKTSDPFRAPTAPPPNPTGVERRMLTQADINIIRQKELQSSDRMNVRLDNAVDKRFIQYANVQFSEFTALKPVDRALAILERGDESMKADVRILADPTSIAEFRRTIQPVVLNGCASSNCHGSTKGGNLILYTPGDSDIPAYTNFYILMQYRKNVNDKSGGMFASNDRRLIERGQGARSLMAQYALPSGIAQQDHPRVSGYDGIYRNMDDPRLKQLIDWMNRSLKQVTPDYGIRFDPPKAPPSSQPATSPLFQ